MRYQHIETGRADGKGMPGYKRAVFLIFSDGDLDWRRVLRQPPAPHMVEEQDNTGSKPCERNVEVKEQDVFLSDVGTIRCSDNVLDARLKAIKPPHG